MHRMLWLRVGSQRLHLLKLAGAFLILAGLLKVGEATYGLTVIMEKANFARLNPASVPQLFGWAVGPSYQFDWQNVVGVLMGPIANLVFWFGITTLAIILYQSGKLVFPIEEYEEKIRDHHASLIRKALSARREKAKGR